MLLERHARQCQCLRKSHVNNTRMWEKKKVPTNLSLFSVPNLGTAPREDPVPWASARLASNSFLGTFSSMSQPAFSTVASLVTRRLNSTTQLTRADDQKLRIAMWDLHNQAPGDSEIFDIYQMMNSAKRDPERFGQAVARLLKLLQSAGLPVITTTAPAPQTAKEFYAASMKSGQQERGINMTSTDRPFGPNLSSRSDFTGSQQSPPLTQNQQAPSGMNLINRHCFNA